jgi:hypothetical protein
MTLDIWVARGPEDELADAIAAADRRKTMDELKIRHGVVVDDPAPSVAGDCGWCPTRRQLASMSDGASRLPQFGRLMASAAGRRAVGEPCDKCVRTALGTIKRRVDARRPTKTSGATPRDASSTQHQPDVGATKAHHVNPRGSTGGRTLAASAVDRAHKNCVVCQDMPEYVEPHPSWHTSFEDYRRWVASGRPPRWPV